MTNTYKTVTSRATITETQYKEFLVKAAKILGVEIPHLNESEIKLDVYDARFDLDEPKDKRVIELYLCVTTNPRTMR